MTSATADTTATTATSLRALLREGADREAIASYLNSLSREDRYDEALGLGDRFDHFDDFVDEELDGWAAYERVGERTTNAALAWLSESGEQPDRDRPLFLWVHYIDPHGPYRPPKGTPANFEHDGFVPIEARRIQRAHCRQTAGIVVGDHRHRACYPPPTLCVTRLCRRPATGQRDAGRGR